MQENDISIFPERTIIYASFWERLGAAFIDGLIISAVVYPLNYLIGGSLIDPGITANIASVIVGWLYGALQESSAAQATLGKRAMGIVVADKDGNRISFGRATGRHFAKWISTITLLIGYLMVLWDGEKQALHDKIAETYVITGK